MWARYFGGVTGCYPRAVPRRAPRYLFVCTANINRSPIAAAWAARLLEDRFVAADIRSAGTHARAGSAAAAYATDAMRELGFDLRSHRSSPLDAELLVWADHVVVMEPMHADVARSLLGGVDEVSKIQGLWLHQALPADHVADPQGQSLDVYRASALEIGTSLKAFFEASATAPRSGAC